MRLPDPSLPWAIPLAAVALIAEAEGCRLRAYRCPAGVWTIGWGHTTGVRPGQTCTEADADRWLCEDIGQAAVSVLALCTEYPDPNELGAMVSLAFNVGPAAFAKSTVLRQHNAGDCEAAARAFGLWDKVRVDGQLRTLPGLTARRAAEAALYLKPDEDAPREAMPQAVEAESKLTSSPIAQGGAVTAGVGVVMAAQDYIVPLKSAIEQAREVFVGTLGLPPKMFVPALLVFAGYTVWRWRNEQRRQGRA